MAASAAAAMMLRTTTVMKISFRIEQELQRATDSRATHAYESPRNWRALDAHDTRGRAAAAIRARDGKDCNAAATALASESARPLDPQPVVHLAHAGAARDDVLDRVPDPRLGDGAIDAHSAVVDSHRDAARVQPRRREQLLANVREHQRVGRAFARLLEFDPSVVEKLSHASPQA